MGQQSCLRGGGLDVKLEVGRVEEAVLGARLPGWLDVIAVTVKPRNGKVHEKKK